MKHLSKQAPRQFILTASALTLALVLSACGGGGSATAPAAGAVADTTPPTVAISGNTATPVTGPVTFTITASEALAATSFTQSDVVVTGGTLGAFTLVDSTHATVVVTPTPNSSGTITIDLPAGSVTDLAGNPTVVAATQITQPYNTIPAAAGNTGNCTTTATVNCFGFDEAALAFTPFGDIVVAEAANDPVNAANKVLKIIKPSPSQPWAGVTMSTIAANFSVANIGLATNKIVTLRVYSPAAGLPILLKLENATDGGQFIQKSVDTTVANAWETLSFDYASPTAGTYSATTAYNKVSVFPNFNNVESSAKTYYFDELKYTIGTAPVEVVPPVTKKLVYSTNYTATASEEGGTTGRYVDDANINGAYSWDGIADATANIRSFYFGYHMKGASTPAWGFGGYVKAPNNGTASVAAYSSVNLTVWGNTQLFNRNPTLTVILIGPTTSGCTPKLKGTIAANSSNPTAYIVAKSTLVKEVGCPNFDSLDTIWNGGVNEVHVQVLGNQLQYVTLNTEVPAAGYPNGLNIGPITFE